MDWTREFPGLGESTYLNSCAHGLLPRRTRAAIDAHLDQWERLPDWNAWNERVVAARAAFARLFGARPGEVALQANATSGVAAVMNALRPGARNEILTLDIDFPTAPFLAERQRVRGFEHVHVRTGGVIRVDAWRRHLSERTALACIPAVASFSGYKLDVRAFVEAAHEAGVPVLVDAFQAAGTYPIDVHAWDADFVVTGVYKWLLAPAGLAMLYARADHHGLLPTTAGWYAARSPYAFDPLDELAPDALRFEYGGPSVVACAALEASVALLHEVGLARIAAANAALVDRIRREAEARAWEVLTPSAPEEHASIITFRVPDLEKALVACARERVVVNARLGGLRVSPHFYNREADVQRLFQVLDAACPPG